MRVRNWLLGAAILGLGMVSMAGAREAVRWQVDLETAQRVAGQTNRLVLIHFWGEGCPPCMKMDREVYARADVATAIERNIVPVKINRDHRPHTTQRYGVSGVPTDVVITPNGQPLEKHVGAVPAETYIARLNQMAARYRRPVSGQYAQQPSGQLPMAPRQTAARPAGPVPGHPAAVIPHQEGTMDRALRGRMTGRNRSRPPRAVPMLGNRSRGNRSRGNPSGGRKGTVFRRRVPPMAKTGRPLQGQGKIGRPTGILSNQEGRPRRWPPGRRTRV